MSEDSLGILHDEVVIIRIPETGLYQALLYRNHPTPSGCPRLMLSLSTNVHKKTAVEALKVMTDGLKAEYVATILLPNVKPQRTMSDCCDICVHYEKNDIAAYNVCLISGEFALNHERCACFKATPKIEMPNA
jgi:hypothetical protein